MEKTLYLIAGPMGVGKTAAGQALKARLPDSVFLDGDWCWDMHPFRVTAETRALVLENISFLLGQFLRCSLCRHVILSWVMHRREIMDELLRRVDTSGCQVERISLVCRPEVLRVRLERDVAAGRRQEDVVERSLAYLPLYGALGTRQIDTSALTPDQVAQRIMEGSVGSNGPAVKGLE